MDKNGVLNLAAKYAAVIREKMPFEKMLIFGSFATGKSHEDSDIDIAIIFKDFENLIDKQVELMRLRRQIDSRIEPHPIRLKDFNNSNPLASEILKYGIEI